MNIRETSKPWYKSKAVIAGIITVFVSVWDNALVPACAEHLNFILPNIPTWIYALLGSLGIYGRVKADSRIGK